ncbi:HEPN domain-containing protein [Streptomyces sp. CA-253872]|uniref:HEPN domain-containing protein n=1 Tax=Streptomyces sp. CA-253872 TaxID=3240067 RepID=UPI003D90D2CD
MSITPAYSEFVRHISAARHTAGTALALGLQVTGALQVDGLLRGALVQGVSALDRYIHEEVRQRLLQLFEHKAPPPAMLKLQIPLSAVRKFSEEGGVAWLDEVIRERHSYLSFQNPDKIADAIRLVSTKELWKEISAITGSPVSELKKDLKLIVARRNSIAHESDISPVPPYEQNPILYEDVTSALNFVEQIVSAIHLTLKADV